MTGGTLRAQLSVAVQLSPGPDSSKQLKKLPTKLMRSELVGDSTHRSFLRLPCNLRD